MSATMLPPPGMPVDGGQSGLQTAFVEPSMSIPPVTPPAPPTVPEPAVLIALAALSFAIFIAFVSNKAILPALPPWLKPFAKEEGRPAAGGTRWTAYTCVLGLNGLAGLALTVVPTLTGSIGLLLILEVIPWTLTVLITALARPVTTPRLLLLQYALIFFSSLALLSPLFFGEYASQATYFRIARAVLSLSGMLIIANMPLRDPSWDASDISSARKAEVPTHTLRSPEDNLTLLQFFTMSWVWPLARLGHISVDDVWQLPREFQHAPLYLAFRDLEGKLLKRLAEANGLDLCVAVSLAIVEQTLDVASISLSYKIYAALDNGHGGGDQRLAAYWCLVIYACDVLRQLAKTVSGWYARKAYERSRGEAFIALFGKLLTRAVPGSDTTEKGVEEDAILTDNDQQPPTKTGLGGFVSRMCGGRRKGYQRVAAPTSPPASNAKVVNLVRGDTYEISQRFWDLSKAVSAPIKVIVAVVTLIAIMGWPALVSFGLMVTVWLLNTLLVREQVKTEKIRTAHGDKRAQAAAHFIEASRPLKLNGWTGSWADRILRFRAVELRKRLRLSYITAAITTVNAAGAVAYPMASISFYVLFGSGELPNGVIWPSIQLFARLEVALREAFDLFSAYWKATIPVERVHKYLAEPDRDTDAEGLVGVTDITFENATFSWPSRDDVVLKDINLTFTTGLTVITGRIGAGKSSLLRAALNEMELRGGTLARPREPMAYCQQHPWLESKTIMENILFHAPMDGTRYNAVIHACCLGKDLESFPQGDQTRLEENGVGLSGGQKARVALARAIYSPSRILLLDDPLAALDEGTITSIVKNFLQGPLAKGRIIVMVTHRQEFVLHVADQVVDITENTAKILTPEGVKHEMETLKSGDRHDKELPHVPPEETNGDMATTTAIEVANTLRPPEDDGETGTVSISVYTKYMAAGGVLLWVALGVLFVLTRGAEISRSRILEAWGQNTASTSQPLKPNPAPGKGFLGLPSPATDPGVWLGTLGAFSVAQVLFQAGSSSLIARICVNAAASLFETAVNRVGAATIKYHDKTPSGQLKNRLTADMNMVDGGILSPLESFIQNLIGLALQLVAITLHKPSLIIILAAVAGFFILLFRIYTPATRCLRRMEYQYLTPIIANIGVMQDGLVTIRALQAERHFQATHLEAVDAFQKHDHFFWSMAFWLDVRIGHATALMRLVLVLFMMGTGTPASAIGFVLTQTTAAMVAVQSLCERFAQLQLDAVSLERVEMLRHIPAEPKGDDEPPPNWPSQADSIIFDGMSFRYDNDKPRVLDRVSFRIPGGSTCAVLGRTGSGKSTVANALLVTDTPCEGTVSIGPVDLASVSRKTLRDRVTYVQQDPTLFPGTLRDNLDPEARFSDEQCRAAIASVLGDDGGWTLTSPIDAAGNNLSQGQRQLVSICRAVLRRSSLVILDEATASIDSTTAREAQRVLRRNLKTSTVVTIAHKLDAVQDADWLLRLDRGQVIYCGPVTQDMGLRTM